MKSGTHNALKDGNWLKSAEQVEETIRKRAYELYELRDREDERDLDDWLKAKSEVTGNADRQ